MPPELRENTGEIEAAEKHKLPKLVELRDIKGDLQMHTTASDGKNSIEEMAEAAKALGHEYIAITDHSKAVTVANGLDEKRMAAHIKKLRAADEKGLGIRVLVGSEVDILKDGTLDYSDEILAQLDVVVCSIHSYFNLERAEMTERMLAAIENPYTQIIGHPTGRVLLRRDAAGLRHGEGAGCVRETWRGDGVQFVSGPAGFEGCVFADVQGEGREGGDLDGFAQYGESELHPVWGDDGAARVAGEEGCDQYAAGGGVFGGAAGKRERSGEAVEKKEGARLKTLYRQAQGGHPESKGTFWGLRCVLGYRTQDGGFGR